MKIGAMMQPEPSLGNAPPPPKNRKTKVPPKKVVKIPRRRTK